MRINTIPLGCPSLGIEEIKAVGEVMMSRKIATHDTVRIFEKQLSQLIKKKYAVCLNSGTSALYAAIKALKLSDPIIMPSYTCESVLYSVFRADLKPILIDIEPETYNISLNAITKKQAKKAGAIIITHTFGHANDIKEVEDVAQKYNLKIIEDFSQAFGAKYRNGMIGSFGDVSLNSFYGSKILTTAHGGAVYTNDEKIMQRLVSIKTVCSDYYFSDIIPSNLEITDIQAAIGIEQLKKFNNFIKLRRKHANLYTKLLQHLCLKVPVQKPYTKHIFYKYTIELPENIKKQEFRQLMKNENIEIGTLYKPLYWDQRINKRLRHPVTEKVAKRIISLPMFPELLPEQIKYVCEKIIKILK